MQIKKVEERILKIIYQMESDNMYSACVIKMTKEFGEGHGIIYADSPEDALKKAVELSENGTVNEYGSKARKFVEKYNWDDIVDDFEGVLEEVIRGGKYE